MKKKIIKANLGAVIQGAELGQIDTNKLNQDQAWLNWWSEQQINKRNKFLNTANAIGNSSQMFGNLLPKQEETSLQQGLNNAAKQIGNIIGAVGGPYGQIINGAIQIGDAVGQGLHALGIGTTDNMTVQDQILGSNLMAFSPLAWINSGFGKRAKAFSKDSELSERIGSDYGGSMALIDNAMTKQGKKFGLFSSGARHRANKVIQKATETQKLLDSIWDDTEWRKTVARNTSQLHNISYTTALNGGFQPPRGYQKGGNLDSKLSKVKGRNYKKVTLTPAWEPVISLEIPDKFTQWFNSIPENYRSSNYDYKKAFEVLDQDVLSKHIENPEQNHLQSVSPVADADGRFPFLKLGTIENNPEIQGEFDWYNSEEGTEYRNKYDIQFIGDRYYYVPKQFKDGGKLGKEEESQEQKNVIPDGALHKNKHHMEDAEGLTKKGIPVVDNEGEQQAEIERDEWIMTLELTKIMEDLYEQFYSEGISQKEKDQIAIDAGKILVDQILYNTDDRTGLINKI